MVIEEFPDDQNDYKKEKIAYIKNESLIHRYIKDN